MLIGVDKKTGAISQHSYVRIYSLIGLMDGTHIKKDDKQETINCLT